MKHTNFPGFVGTLGPTVPITATHIFEFGWLLSFWTSLIIYYAICKVWPTRNQRLVKEMGLGWEEMSRVEFVDAVIVGGAGSGSDSEIEPIGDGVSGEGKGGEMVEEKMV